MKDVYLYTGMARWAVGLGMERSFLLVFALLWKPSRQYCYDHQTNEMASYVLFSKQCSALVRWQAY